MPADFVRKDGPAEYGLALPAASQVVDIGNTAVQNQVQVEVARI
jgi:hypothetical protein